MKKILFTLLGLCFFSAAAFAAPVIFETASGRTVWQIMEQAEIAFEKGELGESLALAENARIRHTESVQHVISLINNALGSREVQRAGDDINLVYAVLQTRNETEVTDALDAVFLKYPARSFSNSMKNLSDWLQKRLVYPEADMLVARIYEAEGEYPLALSFYESAWQNRDFLDIPETKFRIAYSMADISYNMGNYGAREKYLLLVLMDDPVFGQPGNESGILRAMMRTVQTEKNIDKFFLLYRHSNINALKAYQDLTSFYLYDSEKRLDRAFPVAVLAACVSLTAMTEAIKLVDPEYVYTNFADAMDRSGRNYRISEWIAREKILDSFLLLASVLSERGEIEQARSIWSTLMIYCAEKTVAEKAAGELGIILN
ncbi:hypothetical protein K7I13_00245 [Brucepastera parasyntrophica]|uniref:hypothetical protein n=1 Tax=Brucepastera parasyntrophica TaxID=2880008 RepID=UPI00210917DA|nr:hypothetical protein [Brucepastera parasyntrophica]ULQ59829.1 hypothetical protein K7I13_00245 [Brucepastera parasyntrophica]